MSDAPHVSGTHNTKTRHRIGRRLGLLGVAATLAAAPAVVSVPFARDAVVAPASGAIVLADPVIAAAGDIACDPLNSSFNNGNGTSNSCHQKAVSDLLVGQDLAAVLALGDNQYYCGGYQAFLQSYDKSWGRVKSITYPAVGNHEYITSPASDRTGCDSTNKGAAGHFRYFGAAAGDPSKGYYSFDIGTWHLIMLNSNCTDAGGCSATKPQGVWLRADLAAHQNFCTLAFWHVPLFSSGGRASTTYKTFWDALYAADADLVLAGHDHTYERFAPQTPSGTKDLARGIREFVVGTGGSNHTSFTSVQPNSEVRNASTYGVLKLTLHPTSYDWQFVPESGATFTDSGTGQCHGTQTDFEAPTAPTGLTATALSPGSVGLSWNASTDNVGVTGYRVFRDGTQIATVSGTSFTDGSAAPSSSYSYVVTATDAAGNQSPASAPATASTPADTTPPTTPSGLTATSVTAQDVKLGWTASTDDVRVARYDVLRDGLVIGTATGTTYDDTTALPEAAYAYRVVARDAAGNESPPSDPLDVTTPPLPTDFTVLPSADAFVRSDTPTVNSGTLPTLQVDGSPTKRVFWRFPVSGIGSRTVTSAKLRVYCVDAATVGGVLHQVTGGSWTETGVTWNNQPTYSAAPLASLGAVSAGSWYELDVTSLITADGTYELALDSSSSNGADYDAREAGALGPQLVVTTTG